MWKVSHVVPIPKESSNTMSALIGQFPYAYHWQFKCLEGHIKKLLLEYLPSNNLLSNDQFGF